MHATTEPVPPDPLLTEVGQDLLASLGPYREQDTERLSRSLRAKGHDPDLVASALTQQRLRLKAQQKLGERAARMLLTDAGLQQATRWVIAKSHAQRFVKAGCKTVLDMTCGIGADALAFAAAGLSVTAVELDPRTAAFARHNLAEFPNARVVQGDSLLLRHQDFDGIFADPARRGARGRTFNPADYSPPLQSVLDLRKAVPNLGVKVAPGIPYSAIPDDACAQWISVDSAVVEAGLWFGDLRDRPGRCALVIRGQESQSLWAGDRPGAPAEMVSPAPLGKYLYNPDGAVVRSGGLATLAAMLDAAPVSDQIAYLSGDHLTHTFFATVFEVVEVVPLKKLKPRLRELEVGSLEIFKRGVDLNPDTYRASLKLKGRYSATVILTRLLGKHSAILVERV